MLAMVGICAYILFGLSAISMVITIVIIVRFIKDYWIS